MPGILFVLTLNAEANEGPANLIWAVVNSLEFLFVQ